MRRIYRAPEFDQGWGLPLLGALVLAGFVFVILPFTTAMSASRSRQLMLTRAEVAAPVPEERETPPPPPEEKPEDQPEPEPQLADTPQSIPLSADLDLAVGSGGALAGLGDLKGLATGEGMGAETFSDEDLEQRAQPTSQVPPTYPPELRKARLEGQVVIDFVVEETGRVVDARVDRSSHPEFEKSALEAIRKWRFRPGVREGKPVRSYHRQSFRFRPPS
ncbi:MAG: energy transducer TonB [Verrucomicrobia bacterium]|nr:energy transducer TonB [Verrucomicrobiota bacterium]